MATNPEPKKRGRPSLGLPKDEVQRNSTNARRQRIIESGKVRFDDYVKPETKKGLAELKQKMELATQGDVVDILVEQELKRRK